MSKNGMLVTFPERGDNIGNSAMSGDNPTSRPRRRPAGISLFRPGQSLPQPAMTLDLATGREIFSHAVPALHISPARVWDSLGPVQLSLDHLAGNGLFPVTSDDPAVAAFDQLRSHLLHGLGQKGWHRVAVTSPTHGCGKSFVATNLALSLARRPASRNVLIDLDLRRPRLADLLGIADAAPLEEFLTGEQPLEGVFRRFGRTLALGLNGRPVEMASELLHSHETAEALAALQEQLDPEVILCDLPPALGTDDVLALTASLDAVLLVTDGTRTTPDEIRACERQFDGRLPLLGVVLNRAQDRASRRYAYGKG